MTETNSTATDTGPAADLSTQSPGEYLRRLREEKGHTHAAVGQSLHLTVHYIKALESDEYGKLPGLTFVKGYLRAYARFLGADVDNVISRFDQHIAGLLDAGMHTARVERSKRRQDQALRWAIGAGFVVVAGLVAGWWFVSERQVVAETAQRSTPVQQAAPTSRSPANTAATSSRTSPAPATTTTFAATTPQMSNPAQALTQQNAPQQNSVSTASALSSTPANDAAAAMVSSPPALEAAAGLTNSAGTAAIQRSTDTGFTANAPAATAGSTAIVSPNAAGVRQISLLGVGDDELRVTFNGSSWIEVDDGSMVRLYQDMLAAGDTLMIRGEAPFRVLLGDASKVAISLNAAAVDISADIRADSTARLVLGALADAAPANGAPVVGGLPAARNEVRQ